MRLDKFLSTSGIGTRSEVKKYIKKGIVKVNNEIIKDDGYIIDENVDRVVYNNQEVTYQKYHYYMLNKPAGYVTSTKDKEVTVMSLIKEFPKFKLSPVGRLDKDTEGLLIITDDGELIHELTSPKKHIPKTYYVETLESIGDSIEDLSDNLSKKSPEEKSNDIIKKYGKYYKKGKNGKLKPVSKKQIERYQREEEKEGKDNPREIRIAERWAIARAKSDIR